MAGRRSRRGVVGLVAGVALAVSAAACGGDDGGGTETGSDPGATPTSAPSTSFTFPSVPPPAAGDTAPCTSEAYRDAVASNVDGGHYPISNERCDGTWLAFDLDFGADACPPEDDACRGKRVHRAFWKAEAGAWTIITYQGSGDCAEVHAVTKEFPEEICTP